MWVSVWFIVSVANTCQQIPAWQKPVTKQHCRFRQGLPVRHDATTRQSMRKNSYAQKSPAHPMRVKPNEIDIAKTKSKQDGCGCRNACERRHAKTKPTAGLCVEMAAVQMQKSMQNRATRKSDGEQSDNEEFYSKLAPFYHNRKTCQIVQFRLGLGWASFSTRLSSRRRQPGCGR